MPTDNVLTVSSWFGPIRVIAGEDYVQHRPHRKVRGRRRYYRQLEHKASNFIVREDTGYDRMHWHADWPGMGNLSWRERRSHLHARNLSSRMRRSLAAISEQPLRLPVG
jgi:hypothetical protein